MLKNDLSDKLKVAPLSKPVKYQLAGAGLPHPLTGKPMYKSGFEWVGREIIYDEGDTERPNKELLYIKSTRKTPQGIEPIIGLVEFGGPDTLNMLTVSVREYNLYEYLERSNYNGSNPFRDPSAPIFFYRVNEEKLAQDENKREDEILEALMLLKNMPVDAMIRYAKAFPSISVDADPEIIRQKLRAIAKADPVNFVKNSGSKIALAKADLRDAMDLGFVSYEYTSRNFKWAKTDSVFVSVPEGFDHIDWLADHLLNDETGEVIYSEIKKMLTGETGAAKKGKK